jgi:hypothetical protein
MRGVQSLLISARSTIARLLQRVLAPKPAFDAVELVRQEPIASELAMRARVAPRRKRAVTPRGVSVGSEAFMEAHLYEWDPGQAAEADVIACEAPH